MFPCSACSKVFTQQKNLFQHMRRLHDLSPHVPGKISCSFDCGETFRYQKQLRDHLQSFHELKLEKEIQDFPDNDTFETWKKKMEISSGYAYIRRISEKKLQKGEAKTHFICHRSGIHKSESKGVRKQKEMGSNKIGSTCPSTMEVSRSLSDGKVHVIFWKTHIGHDAEIERTPVLKKFRPRNSDSITYPVCVVIPAAGTGERMGLSTPKQYIPLHGKPLICYTVEAFIRISFVKKVVVVASSEYLDAMLQILSQMCALKEEKLMVTEGAESRHQSIDSGLKALQNCCDVLPEIVVIHDGVRPFFSEDIICDVVLAAKKHGAAGVMCPLVSTVIAADEEGFLECSLDRNKFKASEMPQAFQFDILTKAYSECSDYDMEHGTECLHLVQMYADTRAKLLPGTSNLWKVTHQKDIHAARAVVKENQAVGITNDCPKSEFLPVLIASLSKNFQNVNVFGKFSESSLDKFSNSVQIFTKKTIFDVVAQLNHAYKGHKSTRLSSIVHIFFNGFDSRLNFIETQKDTRIIAKFLKTLNIHVYFIVLEQYQNLLKK
ncbi:D-ribitol-5-phosphate cytidylyltransferase-like isoform X2 [Uloborus diversus]|uniref:D-ribitol-5-phosphate cytidylyltransferase-like isoform X2 n=1 Tax=Uloborus diversus TaxID=327109 RepID=UPI00240A11F8|nr:D-ribitol-5-phosphate cytidylyltransferase-like isoform X2 [Uloborus diversus]